MLNHVRDDTALVHAYRSHEIDPATRYPSAREMVRRLNEHRDDGIAELLRAIDVRSAVYCVSDLTAPW